MKTKLILSATLASIIGIATSVSAQESATATVTATIVTPISISKTVDMNFGNIAVQSTTGGTVVLGTNGTRSTTGGVTLPATAGTVTAAEFAIGGQGTYTYTITLPSSDISLSDGSSHTMVVNTFVSNPATTGQLTAGAQTLKVGATLTVAAAQAAGTYTSGTPFTVTVNYN